MWKLDVTVHILYYEWTTHTCRSKCMNTFRTVPAPTVRELFCSLLVLDGTLTWSKTTHFSWVRCKGVPWCNCLQNVAPYPKIITVLSFSSIYWITKLILKKSTILLQKYQKKKGGGQKSIMCTGQYAIFFHQLWKSRVPTSAVTGT
jgi:hypothetical protein